MGETVKEVNMPVFEEKMTVEKVKAMEVTSGPYTISAPSLDKWFKNTLTFLAPLATIYMVSVMGVLQVPGNEITFENFIPSREVVGAMILWILNTVYDFLRKFVPENKVLVK